jgi:glutamine amidotransferase
MYPHRELLEEVSDASHLVVSEPIGDLPGAWNELGESTYAVIGRGEDALLPFAVKAPPKGVAARV